MVELDIALPWYAPVVGGVEYRVKTVAGWLAQRGHKVTVHCAAGTPEGQPMPAGRVAMEGYEVVRYTPELWKGGFRLRFKPELRPRGQVLETHGYPNLTSDWLVKRHRRERAVTIELIGSTLRPARASHKLMRWGYDHAKGLRTLKRADLIQVMTRDEAAWAQRHGVRTRIEAIPNGVEAAAFQAVSAEPVKVQYGLRRYVLFLGRLYHEKNPRDLVEAFALVAQEFPDLQLCFVGPDQGEAAPIQALAKAKGLAHRVVLTGTVPAHTKVALLRGCEFLALPSSFEAQGIVLVEAWAQGRTVLASRVGGVPYLVHHGVNGLLHEPGDVRGLAEAMRVLLANPGLRSKLEKAGEAEARSKYRWEVILPRMEKMYEELAATRRA
ncbi:MAG TPA: glycosyltransferase family 4 protein [Candidatus Thermoplasmatota archaeon]|nr:glycosyltransferase family 4 protein [Candidatus Thermoplasmatota archaeon]